MAKKVEVSDMSIDAYHHDGGEENRLLMLPAPSSVSPWQEKMNQIVDDDDVRRGPFAKFPMGFYFKPWDSELIIYFLRPRLRDPNCKLPLEVFHYVNFAEYHPQELVEKYSDYGEDRWFFFTRRVRIHAKGSRPNRKTKDGYWKATGTEKAVIIRGRINGVVRELKIGSRKVLVFYQGTSGSGQKTDWTMHEYENYDGSTPKEAKIDELVLCTIQMKQGSCSRNINVAQEETRKSASILPVNSRSKRSKPSEAEKNRELMQVPPPDVPDQFQHQHYGAGGHGQVDSTRTAELQGYTNLVPHPAPGPMHIFEQGMDAQMQRTLMFPPPTNLLGNQTSSSGSYQQFYRPQGTPSGVFQPFYQYQASSSNSYQCVADETSSNIRQVGYHHPCPGDLQQGEPGVNSLSTRLSGVVL